MKTNKKLVETLNQKLDNEYNLFIYEAEQLNPKETIERSYEIVIKDKIRNLFNKEDNLNEYQIKGLLSLENTLNSIYKDWKKGNGIFYIDLEEQSTDFVKYVEEEYIQRIFEEIENLPNYELIEIISNVLEEYIDKMECNEIKNRYEIDNFNIIDINKVLNAENGIEDLYTIFENLKKDKNINLVALDYEKYKIINEIILPKLKELEENNNQLTLNKIVLEL